jgi:hypothetical protein
MGYVPFGVRLIHHAANCATGLAFVMGAEVLDVCTPAGGLTHMPANQATLTRQSTFAGGERDI